MLETGKAILLNLLKDHQPSVVYSTLKCFVRIAEFHPTVLMNNFGEIHNTLINCIKSDNAKVTSFVLMSVHSGGMPDYQQFG